MKRSEKRLSRTPQRHTPRCRDLPELFARAISRCDLARSEHARTCGIYAQGNWGMRVIRGLLSEPHLRDGECPDVLEELTPERFRDVPRLCQQQAFIHRDRNIE